MAGNGGSLDSTAIEILNFNGQAANVELLDRTIDAFYAAATNDQRIQAESVLKHVQEHPDSWTRVDAILERSQNQQTKYFGLQILESTIKTRWGALPEEQREGIKTYVSNLIIQIATNETSFRKQRTFLNKLNLVLVDILKQDWPHKWPSFIPDIIGASKTNETLCENSMHILRLLSEEVFDFSKNQLTLAKTKEMKGSFNDQFASVHELCMMVLNASSKTDLIRATLSTLNAFLSWVPLGYILESNMMDVLLGLFPQPPYRNAALQCLTEVAGLPVGQEYDSKFVNLYSVFMNQLSTILPPGTNMSEAYNHGSDDDQAFVQNLALFFTSFFRARMASVEQASQESLNALLTGLDVLVDISYVDEDEILKICLDYWSFFVPDIYSSVASEPNAAFAFGLASKVMTGRREKFSGVLSKLRALMIARMAKPEEVIVVEDENGNVVRETMKDTDVLARYKTMHETLVYLSHLDHEDTEQQMLDTLRFQMNGRTEGWGALNRLCWAIGSVSGSMAEEQENRFLVTVIRDLLNLCEVTRGKDNKAVIASNIMYVVGQYPRFLRNHWKFLKTVVNKQFEFMHEPHPGVQDMACETFLKIVTKCKKKFIILQVGEQEPFISELLSNLTSIIQDLEQHQIHMFYEAVGIMISAEMDSKKREEYLDRLMLPPNTIWTSLLQQAGQNVEVLKHAEVVKNIQNIIQTNVSVCSTLGAPFVMQFNRMFMEMLSVYKMYSELISSGIASGGPHAAKTSQVKLMRSVKKVTLKLIETFVEKASDLDQMKDEIARHHIPAMMDPILGDYARNVPDARDAEVLSLFSVMVERLKEKIEPEVPRIFEAVFECTLGMITKNMEDYPDHRLKFFGLLRAVTKHCPQTLFTMSQSQLKLVIDSVVWAFRHTERNIAETGLKLLLEMLETFKKSEVATAFYQAYYLQMVREIFAVMTDTFHKPGFSLHVKILHHLFSVAQSDIIRAPLWEANASYPSNAAFVQAFVSDMLTTSFPNLRPQQVQAAVAGMMELKDPHTFKQHLRDFLVQSNQFMDQNNAELYADEVAAAKKAEIEKMALIPGLVESYDAATDSD